MVAGNWFRLPLSRCDFSYWLQQRDQEKNTYKSDVFKHCTLGGVCMLVGSFTIWGIPFSANWIPNKQEFCFNVYLILFTFNLGTYRQCIPFEIRFNYTNSYMSEIFFQFAFWNCSNGPIGVCLFVVPGGGGAFCFVWSYNNEENSIALALLCVPSLRDIQFLKAFCLE